MPEINTPLSPKIIEYSDYHQLLRDFYNFKKQQNRNFSFRRFAQLSGIKSSNYLMLVMDRKRKLLPSTARAVAKAMALTKPETEFFLALVKMERARTAEEQDQVEKEKRTARKKILTKDLPAEKAEYLSVWYYSLVRELAFLPDFAADPKWISQKLNGMITETQAENAIRLLVNLGLWKKVRSKITVTDLFLDTGAEERSFGEINVTQIHKHNLLAWTKMLDDIPKSERELGLIHIPINEDKLPELKARIQKFQDEIIGWLQDETSPTQLIQLGTYMIPVTKRVSK